MPGSAPSRHRPEAWAAVAVLAALSPGTAGTGRGPGLLAPVLGLLAGTGSQRAWPDCPPSRHRPEAWLLGG